MPDKVNGNTKAELATLNKGLREAKFEKSGTRYYFSAPRAYMDFATYQAALTFRQAPGFPLWIK